MYFKAVTFVWMSLLVAMQTLQILREEKLSMNPPIACAPRLSSEKGPMLPRNTLTWPSKWNCTPWSYKTKTKFKMSDIQNMKMMSISSILADAAQGSLSKPTGHSYFFIHFYHSKKQLHNNTCCNYPSWTGNYLIPIHKHEWTYWFKEIQIPNKRLQNFVHPIFAYQRSFTKGYKLNNVDNWTILWTQIS